MTDFTEKVAQVIEECRQFARKNGWNEYVYVPYYPLVIKELYEHPKTDSGH